jgi:curli biogenesis system outer membrane secretion channel CsgG
LRDLLVEQLVKDGTYSVIERAAIQKLLAEQNFFQQRPGRQHVGGEDRAAAGGGRDYYRQHYAVRAG